MQSAESADLLRLPVCDLGFVGGSLDDRGRASVQLVKQRTESHVLTFRPETIDVLFDDRPMQVEDFEDWIGSYTGKYLLLDATTLGFVELLFCLRAAAVRQMVVGILYAEPKNYLRRRRTQLVHKRDFSLSYEVRPFSAVPGAAMLLGEARKVRAMFFVGYEGERLDQGIETAGVRPEQCSVVFGVPAFKPGWEMDSFANNVRVIRQRGIGAGGVVFAGAQNPAAAIRAIQDNYSACQPGQRLLLAPIGTKPHAVAVALFACEHPDVGLMFDFPRRREGRSTDVARWHYFEADFSLG